MITVNDIIPFVEYEKIRMERIREISKYKEKRRFELGKRLTLLFENRITVLHQIQEMVYLDKLIDEKEIQRVIDIYSTLLPCDGKIKATLFINAWNEEDLRNVFKTLPKIYNSVYLRVGNKIINGIPEAGREQGEEFSTVQYLTFDLQGEKSTDIEIMVDHSNYKYRTKVPEDLGKELINEAYEEC